jgi:peptide/nickel transport system permease protein
MRYLPGNSSATHSAANRESQPGSMQVSRKRSLGRALLRRGLHSFFLLLGVSVLTFVLVDLAPGEFFDEMSVNPRISPATIAGLRSQHALDRPLPVKYLYWMRSVAKGEWGFSFAYDSPAAPIVWLRARNTLLLTGTATFLSWLVAIPLGVWSASRIGRVPDLFARGLISILLAVPDLVLALLMLFFAVRSGYFPAGGVIALDFNMLGFWAKCEDLARHLCLPGLCLAAGFLPLLLSHVRASMIEVLDLPFIAAARAHGIAPVRVLFRHALPAAANPLISLFGFSLGILLSSSLVIEGVFGWPGLGQLLMDAILQRDFYVVVDAAMLATVFLIAGNLLADILLYAVDPRIRAE